MLIDFHLSFGAMLFWLLVGHVYFDYAGQGDFLALIKNHNTEPGKNLWHWGLPSHALLHAGSVALFTGSIGLGLTEAVIHALVDRLKCNNKISYNLDQVVHLLCKVVWAAIAVFLWRQ
jgi:hypothetical protein